MGPCHHGVGRSQVADGGTASNMEGSCEYIEKAFADSRRGVVLQLGGGRGANNPSSLQDKFYFTNTLVRPKQRKRDMRFGAWNVRRLYRAGSVTAAARELARYKLDLVDALEFRWDKCGSVRAGDNNFFLWKRKRKISFGNRIFFTP